jgi:purine-binding chemotaxis protein CheW
VSSNQQLCTFTVDGLFLGVDVHEVQEVIRYQEMTQVPLSSPVVRGLINLRGQIVTAIDLRRRLELPDRPADHRPMNVVLRTDEGPVSFLVDDIGDVVDVEAAHFERPPETLTGAARELISGAYKLNDRLLVTFDAQRAADVGAEPSA